MRFIDGDKDILIRDYDCILYRGVKGYEVYVYDRLENRWVFVTRSSNLPLMYRTHRQLSIGLIRGRKGGEHYVR
jgi:hypothetical protein